MKFTFFNLSFNERLLFVSAFTYGIGVEAAYFVGITGYAAYGLKAGPALIALIMGSLTAAQMVGSAISGSLIDKFGPRRTILNASIWMVLASLGSQFIGTNVAAFVVFSALMGFFFALIRTAYNSFAPYLVEGRDELKRVNTFVMMGSYIAAIFGPAIGGLIVGHFSILRVFLFSALASTVSYFLVLKSSENLCPVKDKNEKLFGKAALEGVRLVFRMESLRYYLLVGILLWFSFGAYDALESLYYKDVVGVSVAWMGWVNTVIGVGLVFGVFVLSKIPGHRVSSVLLALVVGIEGLSSVLYVATSSIIWVMVGGFFLGVAFGVAEPLMRTLIQADAPLEAVGRVQGAIQVFRIGLTLVPLALAPALATTWGVQAVLVGASLLTVIFAVLLYPEARRVDALFGTQRNIEAIDPFDEPDEATVHERIAGRLDEY